jgi:hypothetical protein
MKAPIRIKSGTPQNIKAAKANICISDIVSPLLMALCHGRLLMLPISAEILT